MIMLIKTRNNIPINYLIIHGLIYHDDEGQGEGADQRRISVKLRWFYILSNLKGNETEIFTFINRNI